MTVEIEELVQPAADRAGLTLAQRRLWSLAQVGIDGIQAHTVLALRLKGVLNEARLAAACKALARRHPALRTRFVQHPGGRIEQRVQQEAMVALALETVDAASPDDGRVEDKIAARVRAAFTIGRDVAGRLRHVAAAEAAPMPLVLMAVLAVLLVRYGGRPVVKAGLVVPNRRNPAFAETVGRFEDVLPLVLQLDPAWRFRDLVRALATAAGEAERHAVPTELLVQISWEEREARQGLGFVPVLLDHRLPLLAGLQVPPGLAVEAIEGDGGRADAELVVTTREIGTGAVDGRIDHAADLFAPGLVAQAARHLVRVAEIVAADPGIRLRDIDLVAPAELDRLSAPYPDAAEPYDERPVHALIQARARTTPDATAIIFKDEALTHGQLEAMANRLAYAILQRHPAPETRVAVALKRSPEAIATILAVMKAGCAFVPIDTDHPALRNDHIVKNAGIGIVLTRSRLIHALPAGLDATVIEIDRLGTASLPCSAPEVPSTRTSSPTSSTPRVRPGCPRVSRWRTAS